uniref:Uncharacterized protein n=1 Tax=viral metagenome TaxID=1070528 RepID=A0A6C0EPR6_9ZZZZ
MPNLDSSDYIRKLKIKAKANADSAADPRKFRALTQHVTYDPYRVIAKNPSFDDGYLENKHYVFKSPCCFVSEAPSIIFDFNSDDAITLPVPFNYVKSLTYNIPSPTKSFKFKCYNLLDAGIGEFVIESSTFNFGTDGSFFSINNVAITPDYAPRPYTISNSIGFYGLEDDTYITLNTNSPISGEITIYSEED